MRLTSDNFLYLQLKKLFFIENTSFIEKQIDGGSLLNMFMLNVLFILLQIKFGYYLMSLKYAPVLVCHFEPQLKFGNFSLKKWVKIS